jgi:hypothetical protein
MPRGQKRAAAPSSTPAPTAADEGTQGDVLMKRGDEQTLVNPNSVEIMERLGWVRV